MANPKLKDRVQSPFTPEDRERLKSWSKFAKEKGLLDGFKRKVLFEAGHYDYVFVTRLHRVTTALGDLMDHFEESEAEVAYDIKNKSLRCYVDTRANGGDPELQHYLGDAYRLGLFGYEEDDKKAIHWFEKASEQGYAESKTNLAEYLLEGEHIKKDARRAVDLLDQAAMSGHYEAYCDLALCFLDGDGVARNQKQGLKYIELAANKGISRAQRILGCMYYEGEVVDKDLSATIRWWERAANQLDEQAMYCLGTSYYFGEGVDHDADKAFELFNSASDFGCHEADHRLGICYFFGEGCEEDNEKAFEYFEHAYNHGSGYSSFWLGNCYFNGYGCDKDFEKAASLFEEASDTNPRANYHLGQMARYGLGLKQDYKTAFKHFMKSAELGSHDGQMALGRAFYLGEGVEESDVDAVNWLKLAVEGEQDEAQYLLGECYLKGFGVAQDQDLGVNLLRAAAEQANEEAIEMLVEYGFEVIPKEPQEAKASDDQIVKIHDDLAVRARSLLAKTQSDNQANQSETSGSKVVSLAEARQQRIQQLMSKESDTSTE